MSRDRVTEILENSHTDSIGGVDVNIQNRVSPALIARFNKITNTTTLTVEAVKYATEITVASVTGMVLPTGIYDGSYLILFDAGTARYMFCHVVSIAGLVVTIDTPLDFNFPVGSVVDVTITNMAVNGNVTAQTFGIRGLGVVPGINEAFDITRILFICLTNTTVTLAKFGDLTKLLKGLVLRHRDGTTRNIFTVKTNLDISGITLDWVPYAATNPSQDYDGFTARLTFSGQDKLGIAQRIGEGEDLEIIVQDDLSGLILFGVIAEGHQVE